MKSIDDFVSRFNSDLKLCASLIVERGGRHYLLEEKMKELLRSEFYYAGTYLGKVRRKRFFPSFAFLAMIGKGRSNKITVSRRTEWLFVCGRDIFKQGILKVEGSGKRGDYTLVLNQDDECLGFGKIVDDLFEGKHERKLAVENISDIGDFLRRER
ncbi:MAG: hypothetical protein JSV64_08695 [Candidatus Bathyarchaeota archaeon]|jgi:ribosome biogenesis protein Nip4|nr:MAG: hypothetical protein JSV64_08695 [Candidatus Bathyarchaeota archaeon]